MHELDEYFKRNNKYILYKYYSFRITLVATIFYVCHKDFKTYQKHIQK